MALEHLDQPLWQNYLNLGLIAFIARRAGLGLALSGTMLPAGIKSVYVGVLAACLFAGIGIWLKRGWVLASLALVAFAYSTQTIMELALGPQFATAWGLLLQLAAAWLWTTLAMFLAMHAKSESTA